MGRLLSLLLIVVHLAAVKCQVETFSSNFDAFPTKSKEVFIDSADSIERTGEINEGSDAFPIRTELLESSTVSLAVTMKHQGQTVEPLELTTKVDKNATLLLLNVPAVNKDKTNPLPDEVMVDDPFSIDEATVTERTVEVPVMIPVVPVAPEFHVIETSTSVTEPKINFSSSSTLSEEAATTLTSSEVTADVRVPSTQFPIGADSTEIFETTTEGTSKETDIESLMVTEAMEETTTVITSDTDFSSMNSSTDKASVTFTSTDEITTDFANTTKLGLSLEESFTNVPQAMPPKTTPVDEDAIPFDQEKLSGIFEQDGSFIPENFDSQLSSESNLRPMEFPEESTEIINDPRQKKTNTTTETEPFIVDTEPSSVNSDIHTETMQTSSTKSSLHQIIIRPTPSNITINEEPHNDDNLSLNSKETQTESFVAETNNKPSANSEETSATSLSFSLADSDAESSTNTEMQSMITSTTELTLNPISTMPESQPSTEVASDIEPESTPQPVLESTTETGEELDSSPQPEPHHMIETTEKPEQDKQPQSEPEAVTGIIQKPDDERQPLPEPSTTPQIVLSTSEAEQDSQPEPQPEPEPQPNLEPETTLLARTSESTPVTESDSEMSTRDLKKTMLTIRLPSIEFIEEFSDKSSGKYRKLSDQIIPAITEILKPILGDSFVGYEITSVTKGSVIINGVILTRQDIHDVEELATKIEAAISLNGSSIGPNEVDLKSIAVNGIPSRAYTESVNSSYPQSSRSSALLIGSMIAVGILVILVFAFIAIAMNNRRTNGTMKLKEDDLPRMENGKAAYTNPQAVSVNLMSYGNGTPTTSPPPGLSMMTSLSVKPNEREVC